MSDAIALKKKVLFPHLDFVIFMLNKSLGTKFKKLWSHVHNCITNDKKKMTSEQIFRIQEIVVTNMERFPTWNKKMSRELQTHQPMPQHGPSSSCALENNHVSVETTTTIYQFTRYSEDFSRDPRRRDLKSSGTISSNKSRIESTERTNALHHRYSSRSPQPIRRKDREYRSRTRSRSREHESRRSEKYFEEKSYYNKHIKEKRRSRSLSPIRKPRRSLDQKSSNRSKSPKDQHYSSRRNARGNNSSSSHSSKNVYPRQEYDSTKRGHLGDSSSFSREREHSLKYKEYRDSPVNKHFQRCSISFSPPKEDQRSYQRDISNFKHRNVHLSSHSPRHVEDSSSPKDENSYLIPPGCEELQEYKANQQGYHSKDLLRSIKSYERNTKRQHDDYYQGTSVVHTQRLSVHQRLGVPSNRNESFAFENRNRNLNNLPSATVTSEQYSKLKRSTDSKTSCEEEKTNVEEFNPRFEEPKEKRLKISHDDKLEVISSESDKSEKISFSSNVIEKVKSYKNPQEIAETLKDALGYEAYMKFKTFINDSTDIKVGEKKSEEIVKKDSKEIVKMDIEEEKSDAIVYKKSDEIVKMDIEEEKSDAIVNKKSNEIAEPKDCEEKKLNTSRENALEEKESKEIVKRNGIVEKKTMLDWKIPKKVVSNKTETSSPKTVIRLSKTKSIEKNSLSARKSTSSKSQPKAQIEIAKSTTAKLSNPKPKKEELKTVPKKSTKPKRNELDRLHDSINEMYDKERIAHLGGPRSCTLLKSNKIIDIESTDDMEAMVEKYKLKPYKVVLDRVNLTKGQTRVIIDERLLAMNHHLERILAPYLDEANDDATGDDLDLLLVEQQSPKETTQKLTLEPSSKKQVVANSTPLARKRSKWSKGILKRKKRISRRLRLDEWEDIESPKKKDETLQRKLQLKQVVDFMSFLEKKAMQTKTRKSDKKPFNDDCVSTVEGEIVSELIKVPESTGNEMVSIDSFELAKELAKRPTLKVIIHPGDKLSTVKPSSTVPVEKPSISLPVPGAIALKPLIGKVIPHCRIIIKPQDKTNLRLNTSINNSSTATANFTSTSTMLQSYKTAALKKESTDDCHTSNTIVIRDVLRPWITDGNNRKSSLSSINMLGDKNCLAALYKCMGSTCSFFTSKENLFNIHLELHQKYEANDNYLICSYCEFKANGLNAVTELLGHIDKRHSYDRFQCGHCFFRGLNDFQVFLQHRHSHHETLPKVLIECENYKIRKHDVNTLKSLILKNVPSLKCLLCSATFYVFKIFIDHLNSHEEEPAKLKCKVCFEIVTKKNVINHFGNCSGVGLFECLYCEYASSEVAKLDDHIAEKHFSERPIFCVRKLPATGAEKLNLSSIESMITQKINKTGTCFRLKVPSANLINESQVMSIGQKIYKKNTTTFEEPIKFTFSDGKLSGPETEGLKIHDVKSLPSETQQIIEITDSD